MRPCEQRPALCAITTAGWWTCSGGTRPQRGAQWAPVQDDASSQSADHLDSSRLAFEPLFFGLLHFRVPLFACFSSLGLEMLSVW